MAKLLKGKPVSDALLEASAAKVSELITQGKDAPGLAVVKIGQAADSESYIRGVQKKCADAGVIIKIVELESSISQDEFENVIDQLNNDEQVNGILLLLPFPKDCVVDENQARGLIDVKKDVDCLTLQNSASCYLGSIGYAPCTAEACMQILDKNGIDVSGKNVVVVGRSLIVGKPLANLLLAQNATVTVCHSKTPDIAAHTKRADIVILATGNAKMFGKKYFVKGQIVVDAGINWDDVNKCLCGDCNFEEVEPIVDAITPVPGGVGAVTSAVIISHVTQNL